MPYLAAIRRSAAWAWAFLLAAAVLSAPAGLTAETTAPVDVRVRESAPEIYYMQDDVGRLVPVPGFRYRDFVDLLRLREGLPGQPEAPALVLEKVVVRAALGDAASSAGVSEANSCSVEVELFLRQSRTGWASLPLDLDGLLLSAAPQYEGLGRMMLAPERHSGGAVRGSAVFTLWLATPTGGQDLDVRHRIRLAGTVAVDAADAHETISLGIPRAITSALELSTPRERPAVSIQPASLIPRIAPRDAGGSVITVLGLSGPVSIRVGDTPTATASPAATGNANAAAVPQSFAETIVRIDGRVATTDARVQCENLPAGMQTLRLSLPPKSTLRGVRPPAKLVRMEPSESPVVAVIDVDRSPDGRCDVELQTERPVDPTGREPFESLGFVVDGIPAWRQWGRVSIVTDGDWQIEWEDAASTRRIDPPASARRPGFVAAFAFDAQPARLPLRVRPRGSRVVLEPEYRYDVAAARVSLDARLRLTVRGAPASKIVVQIPDFEIDEVGPSSIVDATAISTEGGRLVIPFLQPLVGDAVLEIRGGMPLRPDAAKVTWRIPAPQADLVGPAAVFVASQSDIELLPDTADIQGLVRHVAPAAKRSDSDRTVLAYRLDGSDGAFAATRRFLPRRVDAILDVQVDIEGGDTLVRETIRFDVAHVPLEFVTLDVPEPVSKGGTLEARQNGQLLNPVEDATARVSAAASAETADVTPGGEGTPTRRLRAMLVAPLLGGGEVTVNYRLPTPHVPPETTVAEDLPLVMPAEARVGRQSVTLTVPEMFAVDVRGGGWKRDLSGPVAGAAPGRAWTTARPQASLPLALSARKKTSLGETEIEAAWLQTVLSGTLRQDLYAYAVTSAANQVSLRLPLSVAATAADTDQESGPQVEVWLDGRRQPDAARADGRVVVELPPRGSRDTWLLEVAHRRSVERPLAAPWHGTPLPVLVNLEAPVFSEDVVQRRFYWEVVLEPDDHVVRASGNWTSQQRWVWKDFGFERSSVVSRSDLVRWLAASCGGADIDSPRLRDEPPVLGARVVYSGVGAPGQAILWGVPSWFLVLVVSGAVLAIGLPAVYWSGLRRPSVLLSATGLASLAAAAFPDTAPLVCQAAMPGVFLTALAAALHAWLNRGKRSGISRRAMPAPPSSLTRFASRPSLIIAPAVAQAEQEASATGRATS